MSSVDYLREFVTERLTVAAEEIFGVFKNTIIEYEEEIDRQRKLLDIVWKPEIKLHRTELPQQHVCKEEEVHTDQQLCIQERNSSLDQEDPEPPQIKEEQEELCTSQEGEQLELKQETETFMLTPTHEESDQSEDQTLDFHPDKSQSTAETELPVGMCVSWLKDESDWENFEVSEPNSDHQLPAHNSLVAESQIQKGGNHGDSGSPSNTEPELEKRDRSHIQNVSNPTMSAIKFSSCKGKKSFKCDTCGKAFKYNSHLRRHRITHTGEKPHSCNTCGKRFFWTSELNAHAKIHTDEKPYECKICGRAFRRNTFLKNHMRIHTGEKPYLCKTCGKGFRDISVMKRHMTIHSGEKPYICKTCGKDFRLKGDFTVHMRIHTGEKPYTCKTCGKGFRLSGDCNIHMRIHTGEKPYLCKICGKKFIDASKLRIHMRTHR